MVNKVESSAHLNAQSQSVKYVSDTKVACRVCQKSTMHVRQEKVNAAKATIQQQLECPQCGDGYPREMDMDRKTVVADPFMDLKNTTR